MEVFEKYIEKQSNYSSFINEKPSQNLKNVIVIPCSNEPELIKTLDSLRNCNKPKFPVEVIIVINSAQNADNEIIEQNKKTTKEIFNWRKKWNEDIFKVFSIVLENLPAKTAGVGFARKTGMDEAVRRFILIGQQNGIISCLDADSTVAVNYLIEIEELFITIKNCTGCSIYFEHPVSGNEFSAEIYHRITEYELYLRYYKMALQFTGFPYYHYTIGSSFAVSQISYCKVGGMNKKQAGEDFYFLQKVMPQGNYYALNSTYVYPSARPSNRVPFGTGAFIKEYVNKPDKAFLTYHFTSFINLKVLFDDIETLFKADNETIKSLSLKYHDSLNTFLELNQYLDSLKNINSNTSQLDSFKKRFFQWFDAFKILKYLNFVHQNFYNKKLVIDSLKLYLQHSNRFTECDLDEKELLALLRNNEKNSI